LLWDARGKEWVADPSQSYDSVVKKDKEQFSGT